LPKINFVVTSTSRGRRYCLAAMTTTVLIMLTAIVTVTGIAWHGRGRWY
jgi:hypothetical protein